MYDEGRGQLRVVGLALVEEDPEGAKKLDVMWLERVCCGRRGDGRVSWFGGRGHCSQQQWRTEPRRSARPDASWRVQARGIYSRGNLIR